MLVRRQPWSESAAWRLWPEEVSLRPERDPPAPSPSDASEDRRRTSPAGPCRPAFPAIGRRALDSRLCTWHRTPRDPRNASIGAIVAAVAGVATGAGAGSLCCSGRGGGIDRGCPEADPPMVVRSPGGAAPGWAMRDPVLSSLLPGPAAGARPSSRRSDARRDSAERNALASSLTSSADTGGSASGDGRSATAGGEDAASGLRAEGAVSGSVRTSVARCRAHQHRKEAGGTGARNHVVPPRRRRLCGTLAVAQCSSHCRAWAFGSRLRALAHFEQRAECGRPAKVTVRPECARRIGGAPQCRPRHHRSPQRDDCKDSTMSTRTASRCQVHGHGEQHQARPMPHNARRAAATNCPRHSRRRTAIEQGLHGRIGHSQLRATACTRSRARPTPTPPARSQHRSRNDRKFRPLQQATQAQPDQRQRSASGQQQRPPPAPRASPNVVPADHASTTTGHEGAISPSPAVTPGRHPRSAPTRTLTIASAVPRTSNSACSASSAQRLASDPWSRARRVLPSHHTAMAAASARPGHRVQAMVPAALAHGARNGNEEPSLDCGRNVRDTTQVELPQRGRAVGLESAPSPFAPGHPEAACLTRVRMIVLVTGTEGGQFMDEAAGQEHATGPADASRISDIEQAVRARFDRDRPCQREAARIAERDLPKQARIELGERHASAAGVEVETHRLGRVARPRGGELLAAPARACDAANEAREPLPGLVPGRPARPTRPRSRRRAATSGCMTCSSARIATVASAGTSSSTGKDEKNMSRQCRRRRSTRRGRRALDSR